MVLDDISVGIRDRKKRTSSSAAAARERPCCSRRWWALHEPDSGDVWYDEVNFSKLGFRERKSIRKDIGMIFQGGALLDSSTVVENVKLPLDTLHLAERAGRRWSA